MSFVPRTIFLLNNLEVGGTEMYLVRFLKHFQDNIRHMLVCKAGVAGPLQERFEKLGSGVHTLKQGYFAPYQWLKMYYFLKNQQPDIVCDFTGNFGGIPLFLAKRAGVKKRIACYRGSTNHFKEDFFRLAYNRCVHFLVNRYSTKILANSQVALDFFFPNRDKNDKKFEVIYNGLDAGCFDPGIDKSAVRREFGIPAQAFVVGHSARCVRFKNHETIFQVATRLCREHRDIYFLLFGKEVDEKYKDLVRRENLDKQIILPGFRDDLHRILPALDAYYFPSTTEGQPNALIEAMISGLPIVTSRIPPICETTPESIWEELIDPMDVDGAMIKLLKIKNDPGYCRKMQCRDWAVRYFNPNERFQQFLNVLLED